MCRVFEAAKEELFDWLHLKTNARQMDEIMLISVAFLWGESSVGSG